MSYSVRNVHNQQGAMAELTPMEKPLSTPKQKKRKATDHCEGLAEPNQPTTARCEPMNVS
jgi:hypothetical protein